MGRILWYLDEDTMARALVQGLRARGVDVATPLEAGMMGKSDRAQLELASARERVLYTFNVGDFFNALVAPELEAPGTTFGVRRRSLC